MPPVVPVLVKDTESCSQLGAVVVKLAVGVALIVMLCELLSLHWALLTVKVTVFVPLLAYVMPPGFSAELVDGLAPLPKSQLYVQVAPLDPVLLKFVARLPQFGAL